MKRGLALLLPLILLPTSASPSVLPQRARSSRASIVGRWRVVSENGQDVRNHTYQFFPNNVCVEKYLSDQMVGPVDEPPQSMELEAAITYRYRFLKGNRYRLYPIKSMMGNRPTHWLPTWHVISVTIARNRATVDVVDHQETEIDKILGNLGTVMSKEKKSKRPGGQMKALKAEHAVWVRVPENARSGRPALQSTDVPKHKARYSALDSSCSKLVTEPRTAS